MKKKPIVAIVGRPNVGKSTLFNKIAGSRIAIVEDTPGVTRDRIYADAEWLDHAFTLVDTGGFEPFSKDIILSQMRQQAQLAIDAADVILFVTDIRDGVTAADHEVAAMLQKSLKPVILVCNKVDQGGEPPLAFYEFFNLGLGEPFALSSTHGLGLGDLLDEVISHFGMAEDDGYDEEVTRVAVIGKPNVGKSSLVNRILGEERHIVSDIPGTTRDAVDSRYTYEDHEYVFVDTAGMRKRGKINENIEHYSVVRSLAAIDRCDVCLMMLDATEGVTEQDTKIAGYAHEKGRAIIVVVNKWDLVEKDGSTMNQYRKDVMDGLSFMTYAPILFLSAKTGQRVTKLFELIQFVSSQHAMRIATGMLNDVINDATAQVQPPSDKGKRLKILYVTQVGTKPPCFVFFVNDPELFHFSYQRYMENQIRSVFGLEGTPIRLLIRQKNKKAGE